MNLTKELEEQCEELCEDSVAAGMPEEIDSPASRPASVPFARIVVGRLVALGDNGRTPLVLYPGQKGSAAIAARALTDLHGSHIGKQVMLVLSNDEIAGPVVMGVLQDTDAVSGARTAGQIHVDADGERLIVSAKDQLVLRCGRASITLTRSGKVIVQGEYISHRSSGVLRIKGGSVQIN